MLFKSFPLKQKVLSLTVSVVFMFTAVKTQVNIASKASVEICFNGSHRASVGATDGIRDKLSDIVSPTCSDELIIAKFKEQYYIHYFVIYGERDNGLTSSITVTCNKKMCGKYRARKTVGFKAIRINSFLEDPMLIDEIGVTFHVGLLHLNELEIYTFASGLPEAKPLIYRGCFNKFVEMMKSKKQENVDSDKCIKTCEKDEVYIGLKEKECYCAKHLEEKDGSLQPEFYCNATCEKWDKPCGGIDGISVYLAYVMLPAYKECYGREGIKEKRETSDDMTITMCLIACSYSIYATIKGKVCYCVNNENNGTVIDTCKAPCPGDASSYCGGVDAWAYHKTCASDISLVTCSELLKCSVWDENGVCEGDCKEGFLGEHCIERDIDECVLNVCDKQKFDCENTIGSYICKESGTPEKHSGQKLVLLIITLILAWMK